MGTEPHARRRTPAIDRVRRHALVAATTACSAMLGVTALVSGAQVAAHANEPVPVVTGPTFNDPRGSSADQYRIVHYLVSMLDHAEPDSVARVSSLSFAIRTVTDAMIRAYERGVHVRLVIPAREWGEPQVTRLRRAIGDDVRASSYVARCRSACLTAAGIDGSPHSKLFLFSATSGAKYVTAHTSLNLSRGQAERRYNDIFTIVGDRAVFADAAHYFDALRFDEPRPFAWQVDYDEYRAWYFPPDPAEPRDFYTALTKRTRCDRVTQTGEDGRTVIRISISKWHADMVRLATELARLGEAGCVVRVLINAETTEPKVLDVLRARDVETRYIASPDEPRVHSKFIALSGMHRGREVDTVYTGSLNPTVQALERSDNHMVRIKDDPDVYGAYRARFDAIWAQGRSLDAR